MALTCLQIIQTACSRLGIVPPNVAVSSTDRQIQQLVAICNQEGISQVKRYGFQSMQRQATFTTLAAQLQGTLEALAPGYKYIVNDTIWNNTQRRPIPGNTSAQDWAQIQAMQFSSPYGQYRVYGGSLYIFPVPTAGQSCTFIFESKNWVSTSVGGTSSIWTNDSDTPFLDDDLIIQGLIWRWKAAKGLDYAEDFASYERDITDAMSRDGGKPILNQNGAPPSMPPFIIVPIGNFGL